MTSSFEPCFNLIAFITRLRNCVKTRLSFAVGFSQRFKGNNIHQALALNITNWAQILLFVYDPSDTRLLLGRNRTAKEKSHISKQPIQPMD